MSDKLNEIRMENGDLPAFAWPGFYPLVYYVEEFDRKTCDEVCPDCANMVQKSPDEWSWNVWAYDVHWEGAPITCTHCGADIESAYGDPDEDEDEDTDERSA